MKILRYIAVALFALVTVDAVAWTTEVNKAVLMFAEENLSNRAKKEVEKLLNAPLSSVEFVNKGKSKTRLDESGKSVTTNEKDAVVMLEKAVATLENRSATAQERKAALLTAAEMTVDIHCLANLHIDKYLEKNFVISRHNSMQIGFRYYTVKKTNWQKVWQKVYHTSHGVFSAEMYLYDWRIATKGMAKHYKKEAVAPREWAEQSGKRAMQALKVFRPDALLETADVFRLEEVNNACMYDAAFRLANLLNKSLK
ncbi:MAG: hypothetical protein J6Q01_02930 [Alistipes sp.]|nr:hypothetical protein [Alistipes sp.]